MNEIVFLLCQKPSTALKYLLIYNVFTRAAEGTEAGDGGGGVNVGYSLSPPSHFMLATGLSSQLTPAPGVENFCHFGCW